jgi:hypothetical protein
MNRSDIARKSTLRALADSTSAEVEEADEINRLTPATENRQATAARRVDPTSPAALTNQAERTGRPRAASAAP